MRISESTVAIVIHNARKDRLGGDEPRSLIPNQISAPPSVLRAEPFERFPRWREDRHLIPFDAGAEPHGFPTPLSLLCGSPLSGVFVQPLLWISQTRISQDLPQRCLSQWPCQVSEAVERLRCHRRRRPS